MKYVKTLGLAVVVAAALMAFAGAGTASATTLTSPKGTAYNGPIVASNEGVSVTTGGFKNIECKKSTLGGEAEGGGGSSTETVHGALTTVTFEECNCTVVITIKGTFEIHLIGTGPNGTLTSNGLTETVQCSTIFGPVHCNYQTVNTDLGTVTGSTTTQSTATIDITAKIPIQVFESNSLCAEESTWHATYKVTTPDFLDVS